MALRVFSKETAGWGEGPKFKCYSFSLTNGGTFISLGVAELTFASVNEKIILLHHPTVLSSHETPIRTVYKKKKKKKTLCNPGDIMCYFHCERKSQHGWVTDKERRKETVKNDTWISPKSKCDLGGKKELYETWGGVNSLNLNRVTADTSEDTHRKAAESGLKPW